MSTKRRLGSGAGQQRREPETEEPKREPQEPEPEQPRREEEVEEQKRGPEAQTVKVLHNQYVVARVNDKQIRGSIVVSISACHAEDPGSIPGRGVCVYLVWAGL